MTPRRTIDGLLRIVVLALAGFLLVYLPTQAIEYYRRAQDLGPAWAYVYLGAVGTGALLLILCSVWTVWQLWSHRRRKRERRERQSKSPSQLSREQQQQEIDENLAAIADLRTDEALADEVRTELDPSLARFDDKRQQHKLEIVAFGTISSGKSSLLNALAGRDVFATDAKGGTTIRRSETPWPGLQNVTLVDTPGLGEVDGQERAALSAQAAQDADVVLMTVDGPLRDVEHGLLERLGQMEKRVIVCLNKEDWYGDDERRRLLGQLREQTAPVVAAEDVVAVRARPATRARVRVLPDGTQAEEQVPVAADISPLADRLLQVVRGEGESLLLANLLLQSRGLVEEARARVRQALDRRAWQVVERYTWGAAGAAALSPFPLVDLAAGCAISSKMVVDLARVYRQDVDIDAAVRLLGELGKNLIAILGVSAATPAVASVVASLLKSVPGAGTIAGGMLQGIVQALITRWIGSVFVTYFRNEMQTPQGGLTGLARREWDRVTSADELRKLVQTARRFFRSKT
ncbi:MAG TPA: GTP-binding protein [Candidatus Anammoximicrobium sp.]|nr:GTP-binding protein [Candidatus Anammoximicrobium sp.]